MPTIADDHVYDQRSGERGLQQHVRGRGDGEFGIDGGVHCGRILQRGRQRKRNRKLHNDERHGHVLGDRESGGQRELLGCANGHGAHQRDTCRPDDHVHAECTGERGVWQPVHGGGNGRSERQPGSLHQCGRLLERGRSLHDDQRDGFLLGNRQPSREQQLLVSNGHGNDQRDASGADGEREQRQHELRGCIVPAVQREHYRVCAR